MKHTKRIVLAAVFVAIGTVLGAVSMPIGAARVAPFQHFINVISGIMLGPLYNATVAFLTALLRNLIGTGTILAFPGSVVGALFAGLFFKCFKRDIMAVVGEFIGTGLIGAVLAYFLARFVLGKGEIAVFVYVAPFSLSCIAGCVIAYAVMKILRKTTVLDRIKSK